MIYELIPRLITIAGFVLSMWGLATSPIDWLSESIVGDIRWFPIILGVVIMCAGPVIYWFMPYRPWMKDKM